jgi:hypothetical protein
MRHLPRHLPPTSSFIYLSDSLVGLVRKLSNVTMITHAFLNTVIKGRCSCSMSLTFASPSANISIALVRKYISCLATPKWSLFSPTFLLYYQVPLLISLDMRSVL